MKLYLQRDTSGLNARYQVADEAGRLRYTVTGKRTPSGDYVRIADTGGGTVCKIRSFGLSPLSVYSIRAGGETIRLHIAVTNGRAAVRFRGISFFVRGDLLLGSYSVVDADTAEVCAVGKDFIRGCTQLDLHQEERELFCLAAAICIDSLNVAGIPALQMS
ncbi:MAG: hypothetical protein IJH07_08905 [Ruminococcus sp.]|nr:hypothetical protein [Ruminococcus sp.]